LRPWEVSLLVSGAYPGKEKDYAAKERVTIRGPLTPLFSHKDLFENGLIEQAVEFVRRNTGVTARLVDGARREEIWTYPEEAVREAIVNALVHRDYLLSGTDIELSIYEDRLEIISPGKLPNVFFQPVPFSSPVVMPLHPMSIPSVWQPQNQAATLNKRISRSSQVQIQHVHTSAELPDSCL